MNRNATSKVTWVAFVLVLVGAIDSAISGLFKDTYLIKDLAGIILCNTDVRSCAASSTTARIISVLIGIASAYLMVVAGRARSNKPQICDGTR